MTPSPKLELTPSKKKALLSHPLVDQVCQQHSITPEELASAIDKGHVAYALSILRKITDEKP